MTHGPRRGDLDPAAGPAGRLLPRGHATAPTPSPCATPEPRRRSPRPSPPPSTCPRPLLRQRHGGDLTCRRGRPGVTCTRRRRPHGSRRAHRYRARGRRSPPLPPRTSSPRPRVATAGDTVSIQQHRPGGHGRDMIDLAISMQHAGTLRGRLAEHVHDQRRERRNRGHRSTRPGSSTSSPAASPSARRPGAGWTCTTGGPDRHLHPRRRPRRRGAGAAADAARHAARRRSAARRSRTRPASSTSDDGEPPTTPQATAPPSAPGRASLRPRPGPGSAGRGRARPRRARRARRARSARRRRRRRSDVRRGTAPSSRARRRSPLAAPAEAADYVGLGDSYSSGTGTAELLLRQLRAHHGGLPDPDRPQHPGHAGSTSRAAAGGPSTSPRRRRRPVTPSPSSTSPARSTPTRTS